MSQNIISINIIGDEKRTFWTSMKDYKVTPLEYGVSFSDFEHELVILYTFRQDRRVAVSATLASIDSDVKFARRLVSEEEFADGVKEVCAEVTSDWIHPVEAVVTIIGI